MTRRRSRSTTIGSFGRAPARTRRFVNPLPTDPPPERGRIRRWIHGALFENIGLKFLSMVLALTVFLLVNTDRDREITARVGVSYTLPDDKVLVSHRLEEVRITVKGPWRLLRRFDEREIDRVNLDVRNATGGEIAITPDMIHLPSGLSVSSISPRTVRIAFDRRVERVVEIIPQVVGRPQHGYAISEIKAVPATVKVRGAAGTLAALSAIHTGEVSVEGRSESFSTEADAVPPDGVELENNAPIVLHVTIDEQLVTRRFPGKVIAVHPAPCRGADTGAACSGLPFEPARWRVTPAQVEVTLTGTLLAVEKAKDVLEPMVQLTTSDTKARQADIVVPGLPPGIGVKLSPERVKLVPGKAPALPHAPAPAPAPTP